VEDPALVQRLARERVPLTVCPLSNVKLCVFPEMAQHNLQTLLDAGLAVTINSDDPAYFGGYVNQNYLETFAALPGLDAKAAYTLARNSFEASFAADEDKQRWIAELDAVFAQAAVG
jgi:adenosine deaminase